MVHLWPVVDVEHCRAVFRFQAYSRHLYVGHKLIIRYCYMQNIIIIHFNYMCNLLTYSLNNDDNRRQFIKFL